MARRKRASRVWIALIATAIAVVAAFSWYRLRLYDRQLNAAITYKIAPIDVAADRIDPRYEGRHLRVTGRLEISKPPRDPLLGIGADAAILYRDVYMFQWREHCEGNICRYDTGWLRQPIDARRFRIQAGHENPSFPFADARFAAGEIRLGAFTVDPDLVAAPAAAVAYPVHAAALPPNLAATFREANGMLLTGGDGPPSVGEVRLSFRIVPLGTASLTGVQRGAKLTAD